ncbi:MAG: DUF4367 domain-containing protein [Clostridiales bacterium]|nr:DUF4367 domain-containing protein [Clostridiales bacterium]
MTACERSDLLFDALLKTAVCEAYEKEIDGLADESKRSGGMPTPALDQRIEGLIKKSYRITRIKRLSKGLGKAAACLCMLLAVATVVLMSVEATRNAIFNAVLSRHEKYTEIRYETESHKDGKDIYRITYLPEGFKEDTLETSGNFTTFIYRDDAGGRIIFAQHPAGGGTTMVDNENTVYTEVQVSGRAGHLFKAKTEDDSSILIWERNGVVFELVSALDSKELIRIGESIE